MSWNYSGNPSSSPKDDVRFHVGDTDSCDQLLKDGKIKYLLSQSNNSVIAAAIRGCEMIAIKFARLADESVGRVSISFSQKSKAYLNMKEALRQRLVIEDCIPYAGGISQSDKETQETDTDRVQPAFTKN